MPPLISILLPTKNPGPFLEERLRSIYAQQVTDWELIIVDSNSTDGSLAVLQNLAAKDRRVTLHQRPPGLYQGWNFAIQQATGKYVYIATADDTMEDCALERMANALEEHPDCDLCDSLLKLVDANGNEIHDFEDAYVAHHWHLVYPRHHLHIRQKPADFFAHLGGKTVYTSITQVMIRRTLFEKTGLFPENFGPSADFLWGMRAALHANVIFVPEYLSSWRIHESQVTFASDAEKINKNFFLMSQMAQEALKEAPDDMASVGRKISRLAYFKGILLPAKKSKYSWLGKITLLMNAFFKTPLLTMEFLLTLPLYQWRIPKHFIFIYTYDKMIGRHTKRFYRGRITML